MSRAQRFLGGIGTGFLTQIVLTVVGLWLTPFLLSRIGQHDLGLWLVGTQVMAYALLVDIGIVALLPREVAYATGRAGGVESANDLPTLIGNAGRIVLWQTLVVAVAVFFVWLYVPAEWQGLKGPIGIVFVAFVLTFPFRVLPAVLQGLQDLSFVGWAGIGSWATGTVVTVLLVIAHWGLYALAVGWVAAQLVSCVVWWLRLRRVFPKVLPDRLPSLPWRVARSFFARGTWLSMGQLSQLLLAGSDILVIGKLLGPVAVVPYSITGKLVYVLANQPHLLMHVAVPALSEVRASGDRQRTTNVMAALTEGMLVLSGLVVCVILVVNRGFVTWWVHSDQYAGDRLTAVLLLVMALRHWNATFTFTLFALGEERRLAFTGLGDGLVTIVMSIVLVRWMGLIGAPIGGLLGVALVALPFNLRGLAQQTNVSIAAILGRLVPWAWRFAVLVAAAIGLSRLWVPDRFFPLAIATSGVTAIYTLVMIPVVLRGPLAPYLHGRIPRRGQIVLQRLFGMTAA